MTSLACVGTPGRFDAHFATVQQNSPQPSGDQSSRWLTWKHALHDRDAEHALQLGRVTQADDLPKASSRELQYRRVTLGPNSWISR